MLEEYLLVQGREWERYAWIKGRLIAPLPGSPEHIYCANELDQLIRPFVYRRHLDYGVIASIRDLHAQIQHEADKRSAGHQGRSRDIKLGRGGIREIEFLAQMFQLMRGGTDPRLRVRPTLEVLTLIGQQGILPAEEIDVLKAAYIFLRRLEHRIQVWDDQQTHYLPDDELARSRLAISIAGEEQDQTNESFMAELDHHQNHVARLFEKAFLLDGSSRLELVPLDLSWEPNVQHFPQTLVRWSGWVDSPKQKQLPEKSRLIFGNLMRKAAESLQHAGNDQTHADQTLLRFFDLLEAIVRL